MVFLRDFLVFPGYDVILKDSLGFFFIFKGFFGIFRHSGGRFRDLRSILGILVVFEGFFGILPTLLGEFCDFGVFFKGFLGNFEILWDS